jgi:arylsulfatase A-like enzyme
MTYKYRNHAVRKGRWRYIRYNNGDEELYDRSSDPNEWTNLAGRADKASLKAELARLLPAVNAPTCHELGVRSRDGVAREPAPLARLSRTSRGSRLGSGRGWRCLR